MLTSPFPNSVKFVEVEIRSELPVPTIHRDEISLLHPNASPKRVREFSAGRLAARRALVELGIASPPAIRLGARGEPVWPENFVGSISHSDDLAVAAVTAKKSYRGIGVDLQSLRRAVNEEIARRICHAEEISWCQSDSSDFQARLMTIFSAKETLFKALYPLTHEVFYFLDAKLDFSQSEARCTAHLLKDLNADFRAGSKHNIGILRTSSMILTHMVIENSANT